MGDMPRRDIQSQEKYKFLGPVYRHVDQEAFAKDFVVGKCIWVSTLEKCRMYEDAEQGDPGEGTSFYSHGAIHSTHPDFKTVADRLGVSCSGDLEMSGNVAINKIPDAYVVCLSFRKFDKALQKKFGEYCVCIPNISSFAHKLLYAMSLKVPVVRAVYGPVEYRSREYRDAEIEPVVPFIKPVMPFKAQREIRIVITCANGHEYKPFGVEISNLLGPLSYQFLPNDITSAQ